MPTPFQQRPAPAERILISSAPPLTAGNAFEKKPYPADAGYGFFELDVYKRQADTVLYYRNVRIEKAEARKASA